MKKIVIPALCVIGLFTAASKLGYTQSDPGKYFTTQNFISDTVPPGDTTPDRRDTMPEKRDTVPHR